MGIRKNTLSVDASTAPREFKLFGRGVNRTSKGDVIFDDAAAASVMAAYQKHGVDLMIDLEHESLEDKPTRPDSRDARGWAKLELRNGELFAVDVKWTNDGAERLRSKKQRYISPAFYVDDSTGRVTEIVNVAICAMPATHGAVPLVAAGALGRARSEVIGARLTHATAAGFRAAASKLGMAPGQLLRLLAGFAVLAKDDGALSSIRRVLELAPDAKLQEILDAITKVYGEAPAPTPTPAPAKTPPADDGNALGGTAAPAPAKKLTRAEEAYCRKHSLTPAQFAARLRAAVRTAPRKGSR